MAAFLHSKVAALLLHFVVVYADVTTSVYTFMNDDRCFSNYFKQLFTISTDNDMLCSALCNQHSKCNMFMIVVATKSCVLFPIMTAFYYYNNTDEIKGSCRIYNKGWFTVSYSVSNLLQIQLQHCSSIFVRVCSVRNLSGSIMINTTTHTLVRTQCGRPTVFASR